MFKDINDKILKVDDWIKLTSYSNDTLLIVKELLVNGFMCEQYYKHRTSPIKHYIQHLTFEIVTDDTAYITNFLLEI